MLKDCKMVLIFIYNFIKILTDVENYTSLIKLLKDDIILQNSSVTTNKLKYLTTNPFRIYVEAPELPQLTPQEENLKIKKLEREVKFLKKSLKNLNIINEKYKAAQKISSNPYENNFSSLLYSLYKKK